MLKSLVSASNICSGISQLIITLSGTVWGQSQNPIFILNTPLLHPGSLACIAGWLDLLVWVEDEIREPQTLVLLGFGGAQGSPSGNGNEEGSVLRLGCQWDIKAGRCVVLTPGKEHSAFSLHGHWDEPSSTNVSTTSPKN